MRLETVCQAGRQPVAFSPPTKLNDTQKPYAGTVSLEDSQAIEPDA